MRKPRVIVCFILPCFVLTCGWAFTQEYRVSSPDESIQVAVDIGENIRYSVFHNTHPLIEPSPISMTLEGIGVLGRNPHVTNTQRRTVDDVLHPVVPMKARTIIDRYNELRIDFETSFTLVFRAYNDGVAYRFITTFEDDVKVISEEASFEFSADHHVYFPEEESFMTHQERLYKYIRLKEITSSRFSSIPVLVECDDYSKIVITEADLDDYPGMYLTGSDASDTRLKGRFPGFVLADSAENDRNIVPTRRADFLAQTRGNRSFPWRVLVIAQEDGDLVESSLVYKLAGPLQIEDTSWIRPGKVAWDWWNANNVFGVDFRAGINTDTYKHYIDFAAAHGLEYIILDEGWYELGDLMAVNPDIDMEALTAHAREKGVGIILWVVWKTLDDQLEEALDRFDKWGIQGIKVDFMQRDDQAVVNFYRKIARETAKRHLVVDFHGSYKPTGLRRAYPNVLTREGVKGLEHSKWGEDANPENALIIPFTRMVAGPLDYTPGAMINATQKNFRPVFTRPMSQGTRCHQLAMYVVYESPLQMLCDSPSNYSREKACMAFLSTVPTVWDETIVLDAKVADYILIARKRGNTWYVGAMTDWTPRELVLDFSFLNEGRYTVTAYQDGMNADRCAMDYEKFVKEVSRNDRWTIRLAPGGGWAARIDGE